MSTLVAATVKATTLEETTSGDTVTAAALMNPWELVDVKTFSADANVVMTHDGFDVGSPVAFQENYRYELVIENVKTSVDGTQIMFQIYEGGAYVTAANAYFLAAVGVSSAAPTTHASISTAYTVGYAALSSCGSAGSLDARVEFSSFADSSERSNWTLNDIGVINAGTTILYTGRGFRNAATVGERISLYPSLGGTIASGRMLLSRRLVL